MIGQAITYFAVGLILQIVQTNFNNDILFLFLFSALGLSCYVCSEDDYGCRDPYYKPLSDLTLCPISTVACAVRSHTVLTF